MEDPTLDEKAEQFKNKGNDEFKRQNYTQAIDYYNQAIQCSPKNPAYYTNRCIAYIKIENFDAAMRDC
jgi:Flp pilus assembly protein TadD